MNKPIVSNVKNRVAFFKFSFNFVIIYYCNYIYIIFKKIVRYFVKGKKHNIIIVGCGLVGMTLALSLAKKKNLRNNY